MIQKCFILSSVRHILKTIFSKISTTYSIELIGMLVAIELQSIQFWLLGYMLSVSTLFEKPARFLNIDRYLTLGGKP